MDLKEGLAIFALPTSILALWFSGRTFALNYNPSIWITGDSASGLTVHNLGNRGVIVTKTIEHFSFTNHEKLDITTNNLKHKGLIEAGKSWNIPAISAIPFSSPTALYEIQYRYGTDTRKTYRWQVIAYLRTNKPPVILEQGKQLKLKNIINFPWLSRKLMDNGMDSGELHDALFFSGKR